MILSLNKPAKLPIYSHIEICKACQVLKVLRIGNCNNTETVQKRGSILA